MKHRPAMFAINTTSSFLCVLLVPMLCSSSAWSQSEKAKAEIAAVARYSAAGVEIRWIPNNKTILRLGFAHSYTIERSDSGAQRYERLATVKAFSPAQWDSVIALENNPATKTNLELAMDFLFADQDTKPQGLSLDQGIAELNEQKSKEDMVYAIFILTAIKEGKVAKALGLGYIDVTTKVGRSYTYKITLNGTSVIYDVGVGSVSIQASLNPGRYKNQVFVYPGDTQLSFAWSSQPELAGYFVERAAQGETAFTPLNSIPFYASQGPGFDGPTNGSFVDDSLTNYRTYRYRFFGTTAFGEKVLFAEVTGMPRDLTPPANPVIQQPKHTSPKEVTVTWDQYGDLSDLRGFIVARSDNDTADFQVLHRTLLTQKARRYVDTTFDAGGINYYVVYALDTAGNISSSYPAYVALIDSTPPAQPRIASAIIDSLGVVHILVTEGKEKDLKGYRLYKANSPDHEFSVIEEAFKDDKADPRAIKVMFTDTVTLQSLSPKIYYRVRALDFNYNQSVFSNIMAVVRPDTIPPVTPVFVNVVVKEKQVELYFVPSSSPDVQQHVLYRTLDLKSGWTPLKTMIAAPSSFIDTNVTTGLTYYYSIRARDLGGLYSPYASAVYGKPYDTGIRPSIENLTAKAEKTSIILTWTYPASKADPTFIIYKKDSKGMLRQYDMTKERAYTDKKPGKENSYAIRVVMKDGGASNMSEVVRKNIE